MERFTIQTLQSPQERFLDASRQAALVVGGSLFVALCARITIPAAAAHSGSPHGAESWRPAGLGLLLGSRRGFSPRWSLLSGRAQA